MLVKESINIPNNPRKSKNKIFIPPLNLKEQINHEIENSNAISIEQNKELSYIKNTNTNSKAKILLGKSPNKLQTVGTNSYNDLCEDLANSYQDIFSVNLNNITQINSCWIPQDFAMRERKIIKTLIEIDIAFLIIQRLLMLIAIKTII